MPPPSCMVLHCTGPRSNPDHEVRVPEEGGWHQVPVCAEHWLRIDSGELWLWVPGRRLKGVGSDLAEGGVLMGEELAGYGLVIDADVRIPSSHVFSPHLVDGPHTPTLAIDGRVLGAGEHISIELVLTPETVQRLKEALRFFRT
ncbi:MAG: hypothetical protein ABR608_10570 [Pseudonocardiaceae bacterium]